MTEYSIFQQAIRVPDPKFSVYDRNPTKILLIRLETWILINMLHVTMNKLHIYYLTVMSLWVMLLTGKSSLYDHFVNNMQQTHVYNVTYLCMYLGMTKRVK